MCQQLPRFLSKFGLFAPLLFACLYIASCEGLTIQKAREGVLKNDLAMMRQSIDKYTLDKQKPPQSLQDLVDAGYIREVPIDPFTNKCDWVVSADDVVLSPEQRVTGLSDVHSRSTELAANGTAVNTW